MDLKELFDFAQMENLLNYFHITTKLDAAIHDDCGTILASRRKLDAICEAANNCNFCREHVVYGGRKSMELGAPYIYTCGCGLIMCSSPIVFNENLVGSISCGPVMLWDPDEVAIEEITKKTKDMNFTLTRELLESIPSLECKSISAAAQILFIIVNSLTKEHSRFLRQREEICKQQATIADMIVKRKIAAAEMREIERRKILTDHSEKEKELIAFVQLGKKQEAVAILNDILSVIFSLASGCMDTIRVKLFELIAFLSRAAVDSGAPLKEVNDITRAAFEICEDQADFERMCFLTTRAMEGFIETVYRNRTEKQKGVHLRKAIEYIQDHYMDDLSLSTVAESVYVSEYYLSHLFRKEMNLTFSDYAANVRIDKAREFLRVEPSARIQEIAVKTGFNDPNYFAKIFKKHTGASPREYQALFR
jgi:two-component system response regulator YesN